VNEIAELVTLLRAQGFEVSLNRRNHWVVRKDGGVVATMSGTSVSGRGLRNVRAMLRRHGFVDPRHPRSKPSR
jgi:Na+-translocating ferredoxin:NAD+ oxidoreductase RnfG subunit